MLTRLYILQVIHTPLGVDVLPVETTLLCPSLNLHVSKVQCCRGPRPTGLVLGSGSLPEQHPSTHAQNANLHLNIYININVSNDGDAEVGKTPEIALRLGKNNIAVKQGPTFSQCSVDSLRLMIRGHQTFYPSTKCSIAYFTLPSVYRHLALLAPLHLLPISPSAPMLSCSAALWFSFNSLSTYNVISSPLPRV